MKTENLVLMQMARKSLKDKWGLAIGTFVVYMLIIGAIQTTTEFFPLVGLLLLTISGPMALGIAIFSIMLLFTLLWTLLLIIPGIIAVLSYSMTFYILADDNSIGAMEAIDKSKKMMDGYKWKYFCLGLRFIGWSLLCILTLGIGFLWLLPYMQVSMVKFYDDIK